MVPAAPATGVELDGGPSCWPWPCTTTFFTGTCYSILCPCMVLVPGCPWPGAVLLMLFPLISTLGDSTPGPTGPWESVSTQDFRLPSISAPCESLRISLPGCSILFQNPAWKSRTGRIKKFLYKNGARESLRRDLQPRRMIRLSANMPWPFLSC